MSTSTMVLVLGISFSYKDDRIRIQRKGHIGKGEKFKRSWNIKEMILMWINSKKGSGFIERHVNNSQWLSCLWVWKKNNDFKVQSYYLKVLLVTEHQLIEKERIIDFYFQWIDES